MEESAALHFSMTEIALTFDELPGAVSSLTELVRELSNEVKRLRSQIDDLTGNSKQSIEFAGIDVACRILGKAKSTIYALAREGKIPAYKGTGDKEWRFIESELIDFIKGRKRESHIPSFEELEATLRRVTRCRKK